MVDRGDLRICCFCLLMLIQRSQTVLRIKNTNSRTLFKWRRVLGSYKNFAYKKCRQNLYENRNEHFLTKNI